MQFFVLFLMMPVIFVIVEYEISHFFLEYNLIVHNHKSFVFLVSGKFFARELFLVAMYWHVS